MGRLWRPTSWGRQSRPNACARVFALRRKRLYAPSGAARLRSHIIPASIASANYKQEPRNRFGFGALPLGSAQIGPNGTFVLRLSGRSVLLRCACFRTTIWEKVQQNKHIYPLDSWDIKILGLFSFILDILEWKNF